MILDVQNLTVALPPGADRPHAVENVSFGVAPGEIICIVGESGSGKSVSAGAIMGLLAPGLRPTAGRIAFEGRDLLQASPTQMRALRGARLGMIFQEPMTALNPLMRVGDQLAEVMQVHGQPVGRRVHDLLEAVHLPDPARILRSHPHRLSGGQRQRVMIAMALALEPAILIADEPTTALDVTTQMQILHLIREVQQRRGTGVLFITHDFGVVAEIADRVAVMQRGQIVEQGPAATILGNPQHPYTRDLIAAVPHRGRAARPPVQSEPVLRLQNVGKTYHPGGLLRRGPGVQAVAGATIEVRRGETLGLVGESGSGKSTLARCVVNLVQADTGHIWFHDTDLRPLSRSGWAPFRRRVQMVFQDPFASLNPRRRIGDIIAEGPIAHGTPKAEARDRAAELLRLVQLDPSAAAPLPPRVQRRPAPTRRHRPRPSPWNPSSSSPTNPSPPSTFPSRPRSSASSKTSANASASPCSSSPTTSAVAAQVCDRVAVMQRGRIVEQGETQALFAAPTHPYTQAPPRQRSRPSLDPTRTHPRDLRMRIAVGGFLHESHSFAPRPTTYGDFLHPGGFPGLVQGPAPPRNPPRQRQRHRRRPRPSRSRRRHPNPPRLVHRQPRRPRPGRRLRAHRRPNLRPPRRSPPRRRRLPRPPRRRPRRLLPRRRSRTPPPRPRHRRPPHPHRHQPRPPRQPHASHGRPHRRPRPLPHLPPRRHAGRAGAARHGPLSSPPSPAATPSPKPTARSTSGCPSPANAPSCPPCNPS